MIYYVETFFKNLFIKAIIIFVFYLKIHIFAELKIT